MSIKFFKKRKNSNLEEIISEENHEIEEEEREMIKGIFGLGETAVRSIMVPRTDVVAISVDEPFDDIVKTAIKSGHSRIPVYEGTIDNVIGFLHIKDLLSPLAKKEHTADLKKLLRPVRFVPEGKMIDDLLREFKKKKEHIVVVVDEYGGMAGIACLENILEEIVGEIQDEYDNEEEGIKEVEPYTYLCDARTLIHDVNEGLQIDIPSTGSDTLGGFVFDIFGKIPVADEKIIYNNIEFKIEVMEGHSIKKVRVNTKGIEDSSEKDDSQ